MYVSNSVLYGKPYGSGYCYLCTNCGAYVGTHKPRPKEAMGILADKQMREWKKACHYLFDSMWKDRQERKALYRKLAEEMSVLEEECHFGYFNLAQLLKAYEILVRWRLEYD